MSPLVVIVVLLTLTSYVPQMTIHATLLCYVPEVVIVIWFPSFA